MVQEKPSHPSYPSFFFFFPQVPVKKNAELCNFISIEQKKREEWRTEKGGGCGCVGEEISERGDGGVSERNRWTAVGQAAAG